ncbi:MAG: DUF1015 domain-containing protein [Desulfobacterales bacterium]|jgi:uncharacterized protein (DUF1015 family)
MANVKPFRGIRYSDSHLSELGSVTTPPYDVISGSEQAAYYERHPHNMIRLILARKHDGDSDTDNPHTRAADDFTRWLEDGILVQDASPAYYLTAVDFTHLGRTVTRFGLIAKVELEPFEKGIILPHEETYSGIKTERLGLMKACHANLSPIFSLFHDTHDIMAKMKNGVAAATPAATFRDSAGDRHRFWLIKDDRLISQIENAFADERLYIADGHHRYETALAYREWAAGRTPGFHPEHPSNYIMMYLASMQDPGMVILPAHRLVSGLSQATLNRFLDRAETLFRLEPMRLEAFPDGGIERILSKDADKEIRIGVVTRRQRVLMRAPIEEIAGQLSEKLPAPLATLDVSVLTHLVFGSYLGILPEHMDDVDRIRYTSSSTSALTAVSEGQVDAAFLLNPTRIGQVQRIAEEGLIMPRKTTYFSPKVLTGCVINSLRPD